MARVLIITLRFVITVPRGSREKNEKDTEGETENETEKEERKETVHRDVQRDCASGHNGAPSEKGLAAWLSEEPRYNVLWLRSAVEV